MRKVNTAKMKIKKMLDRKLRKEKKRKEKKHEYKKNQLELAAKLKKRGEQPYSSKKRRRNV